MANEKAIKANEERVRVFVPTTYAQDDPNLYVSINGRDFLLPRGEYSEVPLYVKKAIDRQNRAIALQDKRAKALEEKAKKPLNAM
jgi:hypothetical protein